VLVKDQLDQHGVDEIAGAEAGAGADRHRFEEVTRSPYLSLWWSFS
jgi:hypothetical protein